MAFYGYHGVNPEERKVGQSFTVDLQVYGDFRVAGRSDNLEDTLDYSELYRLTKDVVEGEPHNLLEWVAETIAQRILESFKVTAVTVRVTKPSPPHHRGDTKRGCGRGLPGRSCEGLTIT